MTSTKKHFEHDFYVVTALTNLHAGSGDTNYGLVDKTVQCDPATKLPTVFSSSLKGALREYFEVEQGIPEAQATEVFGTAIKAVREQEPEENDSTKANKGKEFSPGRYRFFGLDLLSFPARSSHRLFHRIVAPDQLASILNRLRSFSYQPSDHQPDYAALIDRLLGNFDGAKVFEEDTVIIESYEADKKNHDGNDLKQLYKLLGEPLALLTDKQYKDVLGHLPVIARNQLENGESQNLWYEEIVPRETRFLTVVSRPTNCQYKLDLHGHVVQIGANGSIGYGLCLFEDINKLSKDGKAG